jgi:hypothetical protein
LRTALANSSRDPHLPNNQSKIDWKCGLSTTALKVQSPAFKPHPPQKKIKNSWARGVAQVAVCLPSKPEALSSNPSTEKKKKKP